jgi:hypothetical protein
MLTAVNQIWMGIKQDFPWMKIKGINDRCGSTQLHHIIT